MNFIKNKVFEKTHKIEIDEKILDPKNIKQFFNESKCHQTIKAYGNQKTKKLQGELGKREKEIIEMEKKLLKKYDEKDQLINRIMALSYEINSAEEESLTKELERAKIDIEKHKEDIETLKTEKENKLLQVKEVQKELYKTMVEISYTRFLHEQRKLSKVQKNINGLRVKLDVLRGEKEGIEERLNELYQMLHGVMGHQQMEQMDLTFLKEFSEEAKEEKNHD